jgi:8-oxo-dGTP pyrophosphatase MutT (NUDIX family)
MDRDGATTAGVPGPAYAATVLLLRDGERGVEVLLAERPGGSRSFAGAWVFPGGVVEPGDVVGDDPAGEATARRAAVRETSEEIGLTVDPAELVPLSIWTPPTGSPKTLITTFFAVRVPEGQLRPAPGEVVAVRWLRPCDALERHAAGAMTLWPPTWVTLHGLATAESVDAALAALRAGGIHSYISRFSDDRRTVIWREDAEYAAPATTGAATLGAATTGAAGTAARHRLVMERLPWVYLSDF